MIGIDDKINRILSEWLGKSARCTSIEPMTGGMINSVLALEFDTPPHRAVVKLSDADDQPFACEVAGLEYLKKHSRMPVPAVYKYKPRDEHFDQHLLLIEMLPGINLGEAVLTHAERRDIDRQLADILLELHSHERDTFGPVYRDEHYSRWLDEFAPMISGNFEWAKPGLTTRSLDIIPHLLEAMPAIMQPEGRPTLVHGDIWETNVIVDRQSDHWTITGMVDPDIRYADVEYELAYLEIFSTITDAFFECYYSARSPRPGYELRRLYYWLNTLLLHVAIFGDGHYVRRTERIAVELAGMV